VADCNQRSGPMRVTTALQAYTCGPERLTPVGLEPTTHGLKVTSSDPADPVNSLAAADARCLDGPQDAPVAGNHQKHREKCGSKGKTRTAFKQFAKPKPRRKGA
jgi:hypothetical protein